MARVLTDNHKVEIVLKQIEQILSDNEMQILDIQHITFIGDRGEVVFLEPNSRYGETYDLPRTFEEDRFRIVEGI